MENMYLAANGQELIFLISSFVTLMASVVLGTLPMASQSLKLSPSLSFSHSQSSVGISVPTSSISLSTSASLPLIYCGRGDKKTAKGKRFNHSFGNARPRNKNKGRGPPRVSVPPAPPKKDRFDDDEVVKIDIDESLF
ncbi:small ribosomal subunit protein bTHXc-like [Cornus florida]|uniref:small ribosomal subunit protein bTHXc-like n=1 Tax=Cornus florida TaxID=4283 RepID=UPI00289D44B7|nr:small ribosomal subunit protein bTHXc-like [Cornus florida]